ncbi:MAG: hypothetical protein ACI4W6_04030 [Acutalibacteraceae bacterium]
MKKFTAILLTAVLMLSTAACSAGGSTLNDEQQSQSAQTTQSAQATQAEAESVSVNDYGFRSMNPYDETLKLTDSQRQILKYYDINYFQVEYADSLARSPQQFRGMKLVVTVNIKKILESNDQTFTVLGDIPHYNSYGGYYESNDQTESAVEDYNGSVVIKGPQLEQRLMVDDFVSFFGVFEDVESYTVDGKSYQLATIKIYDPFMAFTEGNNTADIIDVSAKAIFGDNATTREAKEGIDFEYDEIHNAEYFKIVEIGDGDSENSFEIYSDDPRIVKSGSTNKNYVTVQPAADFEHFYFLTQNLVAGTGKIEYMSKDFKPIWSITLENAENLAFDYNRETLMYMQGSDLHIVEVSNGKEKVEPVYVGERDNLAIAGDGCAILSGKGDKDNIIKVDADGKILWRADVPMTVSSCKNIQIKSDSSAVIGLLDETNSLCVVSFTADGSFKDPIYVYDYGMQSDEYMNEN